MNDEEFETTLHVIHVYEHDKRAFELEVNEALRRIVDAGGMIADIQYAIDSSTAQNARGGFGALIVHEIPVSEDETH